MSYSFIFCLISTCTHRLCEMSKFNGTKTTKGGSENGILVFNTGPGTRRFSHDSLRQKISVHRGIDHSEKLKEMRLYKVPLVGWQLTQVVFNHQFVVIYSSSWWWSIERDIEKILLQRSKFPSVVRNYNEGFLRKFPVVEIKRGDCKGTMKNLIEFLHCKGELKTEYDFLLNNCKTLANNVFDRFVAEGTVKRTFNVLWTVTLQMKSCFIVI